MQTIDILAQRGGLHSPAGEPRDDILRMAGKAVRR